MIMIETTRRTLAVAFLAVSLVAAQESPTAAQANPSRIGEIEAARRKKAEALRDEPKSKLEEGLIVIKERRLLDKWQYGWGGVRPRIGALVTGSGFAAGPEYLRDDLKRGNVRVRLTTQFSASLYQLYDAELAFPKLAEDRVFVSLGARHRNYPRMQYYGPGPDSRQTGRSDYRLEDTRYGFVVGMRPIPQVRFGVTGDLLQVNIGAGTSPRWISADQQYTEAQTPGIQRQTDFLQGGVFGTIDTRDVPGGPKSGTLLHAEYTYNKDIDLEQNTHKRLNLEAQQYIPFFNKRRVIALRGRSEVTYKNPGQVVPFYLQPQLGGSNDLRGFRPFRFYDDNLIVFNAEYRYEVFAGMDMAVFGDAGKVFKSKNDWNLHDLEGSYGVGMRFNARNAVFMRLDVGFSHEGFQVWLKFNNVF